MKQIVWAAMVIVGVSLIGLASDQAHAYQHTRGDGVPVLVYRLVVPGVASDQNSTAVRATAFSWYRSQFPEGSGHRVCDPSLPVPPNGVADTGLCVRFTIVGALGVQLRQWALTADGKAVQSGSEYIDSGHIPTPGGLTNTLTFGVVASGRYHLDVWFDGQLAGSSDVAVP